LDTSNIHHYLVGAQGALPVDAAGNPWSGSYVYNSGNLVLDLLYNLMLEAPAGYRNAGSMSQEAFGPRLA
jgi:Mn-containing catalase